MGSLFLLGLLENTHFTIPIKSANSRFINQRSVEIIHTGQFFHGISMLTPSLTLMPDLLFIYSGYKPIRSLVTPSLSALSRKAKHHVYGNST